MAVAVIATTTADTSAANTSAANTTAATSAATSATTAAATTATATPLLAAHRRAQTFQLHRVQCDFSRGLWRRRSNVAMRELWRVGAPRMHRGSHILRLS